MIGVRSKKQEVRRQQSQDPLTSYFLLLTSFNPSSDMKKHLLLLAGLMTITALQAQWVNDPVRNTRIANCNKAAAEVSVSTDGSTGDTYVQWLYQGDNHPRTFLRRKTGHSKNNR